MAAEEERKEGRKMPPPSLLPLSSSTRNVLHLCFPLLAARFSSKGRVDGPIKSSIAALLGKRKKKVCGGKHSPPAEIFVFGISMRNCARGVTRNVRISGSGAVGIWLNAAAQRARSLGSCAGWPLLRLRQVFCSFLSCYFVFCRCCVLIMKATRAVDQMTSR